MKYSKLRAEPISELHLERRVEQHDLKVQFGAIHMEAHSVCVAKRVWFSPGGLSLCQRILDVT